MLRISNEIEIVIEDIKAWLLVLYKPLKLSEIRKMNLEDIIELTFHHSIL